MVRAAIDVGSNSVLLLVERRDGDRWTTLCETSEVTGLGRGTKESGVLAEEPMRDTLNALARAYERAREMGAEEVRAGGTMALRIAANSAEFVERARAQGTPVVVLTGEEEARLGFDAVANDPLFADARRLSIVDPGGHSTELATAERTGSGSWRTLSSRSYPVGALALRDGLLSAPTPSLAVRLEAAREIDDLLGMSYLPWMCGTVVVLGATGTNLASIRLGLREWDSSKVHGYALDYEDVGRAVGWMCDLDDAGRRALTGIEPGRERTLHIGLLILERFLFCLRAPGCVVSARGWRHALLER